MTHHLNEEQLYTLLDAPANDAPASVTPAQQHLRECAHCRAEFAELQASLAGFRHLTTSLATPPPALRHTVPAPKLTFHMFSRHGIAASFATALLLLGVSLSVVHPHRNALTPPATNVTSEVASSLSDEALLDGINRDLSASVPPSLQPLALPADSGKTTTKK
jgi:predicted anti-sigma-YlaC factor YlaD